MRHRIGAIVAVFVLALTVTGSALAFDCIRVSSSLQGLQQSTKSGNWLLFDFSTPAAVQSTLAGLGTDVTADQASCLATTYAATGQPQFFALGIGVAGGKKTTTTSQGLRAALEGFGVIAWHNPNDTTVLANGKGIDHFEDSPILGALFGSAAACGIDVS